MHNVLLQGAGQPTASLLPTWMSGYGFVFSTEPIVSSPAIAGSDSWRTFFHAGLRQQRSPGETVGGSASR